MLKKLLLGALAGALFASTAFAQVNVVPQVGLNTANLRQNTYSAVSIGLVPAASATDIVCLQGSATKTIHLTRVTISGSAGTAITTPFVVLLRHSLDTGGTPASGVALPVAAPNDQNNQTATATLNAWTANPTITDASPNYYASLAVTLPVTASSGTTPTILHFGAFTEPYNQDITIRGVAQAACINLQAASVSSGVLSISLTWWEQ